MRSVNRRVFLKAGISAFMGIGNLGSLAAGRASSRPRSEAMNVVLIICDDLNDSVAGMGGHPQALTPNIDRLIQRGVRFNNAHCNAPICAPSRAALWTGIYPHTSSLFGYNQDENHWRENPVLWNAVTVFEHFMAHGYRVYGTGKIFHKGHEDNSVWIGPGGFNGLGIKPSFGPFPWDGVTYTPYGHRQGCGHPSMPQGYNGYWKCFAPLSDIPTVGAYTGWSMETKDFHYVDENDRDLMPDELSAEWAAKLLSVPDDKPFFITMGVNRPHAPRYVPAVYYDLFPLDQILLPPYLENDREDCAEILWKDPVTGRVTADSQELSDVLKAGGAALWKRWVQSYLASAAYVDAQVGAILDAIDAGPYKDNTLILLTSDHGFHMGEKDHMNKITIWEETTRVPLVIAVPGLTPPQSECGLPVSLIDLYPTLADLCGLPGDPNAGGNGVPLGGHSLKPLLENPQGSWSGPPVALSCRHGWDPVPKNQPARTARQNFSVRSERWRYTLCYDGAEELYDHDTDPHEWLNLAAFPQFAAVKRALREQLYALTGLEGDSR